MDENIYENYGEEYRPTVINENNDIVENIAEQENKVSKKIQTTKWQEITEDNIEDHEDEIRAFEKAKREYDKDNSDSEDENLNQKRKRHDTDDEESITNEKKNDTEDELDELLPQQNEDGDIIISEKPIVNKNNEKHGLITLKEYQANKSITRNVFDEIAQKPINHETVYRDKEGRKIKRGETQEDKKKKLKDLNEKQLQKWMKGFKQVEDNKKKEEESRELRNEPLARYDIDKTFENELKMKERFGDPMKELLEFQKSREEKQEVDENVSQTTENNLKKNLTTSKNTKKYMRLVCKFKAPTNRYVIEPGYMWDGVDRSNGFELKLLGTRNVREAQKNEYYKLRTEEM